MARALGKRQAALLISLTQRPLSISGDVGVWHRRCGWVWDSELRTIRSLEGLRKLGLVRWDPDLAAQLSTPANETYRITQDGLDKAAQLKEAR